MTSGFVRVIGWDLFDPSNQTRPKECCTIF